MPDPELKKNLKQAMSKPRNFVLAAKGKNVALFLSKKPIQPPKEKEIRASVGATKSVIGVVQKDDAGMTFKSTEKFPPVGREVKKLIKDEAGITVDPNLATVDSVQPVDLDVEADINVDARRKAEVEVQIQKLRDFVGSFNQKLGEFQTAYQVVQVKRTEANKAAGDAKRELQEAKGQSPQDASEVDRLSKLYATLDAEAKDIFDEWKQARENIAEVKRLNDNYTQVLQAVATKTDFDEIYDMLQPGRSEAIEAVQQKMEDVFARTNKRLAILGRTKHTFEGDESWAAKHPDEKGRVLAEDDWSMAVNDAFIKAGLDQKAEFAMITKFKDQVLAKIKELTMNPEGRTKDELKSDLREFVQREADPALFTGGRHNDGFAVSMVELEQLIDDGYVMMQHDPDGRDKDVADQEPEQVMVPSGKGQAIKEELARKAKEHEDRVAAGRKKVNDDFVRVLESSRQKIKDSPQALKVVRLIKTAMDENRWDDADDALQKLQRALA